jgi:hypothetical protein
MAYKGEISWRGRTEEGLRREVFARRVGSEWRFCVREKRFDRWEPLERPPLEDWLMLLDGVRRRIGRRLLRPEEEHRVRRALLERYPGVDV